MTRWFISDTHFGHANIIRYCDRPFRTVEDMDKAMLEKWNSVVSPDDEVFFVGDFSFGGATYAQEILEQLHGVKHLILGNHDNERTPGFWNRHFVSVETTRRIVIDGVGRAVTLCHYPTFGPKAPQLLIHGHSHNNRPLVTTYDATRQTLINVSVENLDYTPIPESRIAEFVEQHEGYFKSR